VGSAADGNPRGHISGWPRALCMARTRSAGSGLARPIYRYPSWLPGAECLVGHAASRGPANGNHAGL